MRICASADHNFENALALDRGQCGIRGAGESDEEGIALCSDLVSECFAKDLPAEFLMRRQRQQILITSR
jgi:hypothetical protein